VGDHLAAITTIDSCNFFAVTWLCLWCEWSVDSQVWTPIDSGNQRKKKCEQSVWWSVARVLPISLLLCIEI